MLGIVDENEGFKFNFELEKVKQTRLIESSVYTWGSNKYGQLGVFKGNMVQYPIKVDVPDCITVQEAIMKVNSIKAQNPVYIEDVICSSKISGLVLSNGDLWLCGNSSQKDKETAEEAKYQQMLKD